MSRAQENPKKLDAPLKCPPLAIALHMLMSGLTITQVCKDTFTIDTDAERQQSKNLIQAMAATSNSCQKHTSPL